MITRHWHMNVLCWSSRYNHLVKSFQKTNRSWLSEGFKKRVPTCIGLVSRMCLKTNVNVYTETQTQLFSLLTLNALFTYLPNPGFNGQCEYQFWSRGTTSWRNLNQMKQTSWVLPLTTIYLLHNHLLIILLNRLKLTRY